ncbi:hypothetical protein DYB37_006880 [Aphanomyces astaci]|uniref:Uncharacterized protein n=1 Tax=Aphanomyces astaci TaxID=112090 RepID=A0A3R6WZV4_APHAT|nr:hypothetical protein DYB35_006342 [Aphanomyces astaci]RHZ34307.1 hypothetical protein DYB37_006880 [Aphanomyces astaci]
MFPSFSSLSERKKRLAALQHQVEQNNRIDAIKRQAYENAVFAIDNTNKIQSLIPSKFSVDTNLPAVAAVKSESIKSESIKSEPVKPEVIKPEVVKSEKPEPVEEVEVKVEAVENMNKLYKQRIVDEFNKLPKKYQDVAMYPFNIKIQNYDQQHFVKTDGNLYDYGDDGVLKKSKTKRSLFDWKITSMNVTNYVRQKLVKDTPAAVFKQEFPMAVVVSDVEKFAGSKKAQPRFDTLDPNDPTIRKLDMDEAANINDASMTGKGLRLNKLVGRGFKGAGTRETMNKEHLQKQIGTKFVVLKALREGNLVLRYPSGTSVARKLPVSQAVVGIVDDVITDKKFDASKYDKLSNDDKKVIYDLFKITRYDQTLRNPLMNPYELDEAEKYLLELDKLKGELMLGNRNERNIQEFCKLSSYLYKLGVLSNKQLQENISLLS